MGARLAGMKAKSLDRAWRSNGKAVSVIGVLVAAAVGYMGASLVASSAVRSSMPRIPLSVDASTRFPEGDPYTWFESVEGLLADSLSPEAFEEELLKVLASDAYTKWTLPRGVVYMRPPDTVSRTMASIWRRMATAHQLNCPSLDERFAGVTFDFSNERHVAFARNIPTNLGPAAGSRAYDVWTERANYSPLLEELVPSAGGLLITSVRDVYSRQRSLCAATGCCTGLKSPAEFNQWVVEPESLESAATRHKECLRNPASSQLVGTGIDPAADAAYNTEFMLRMLRGRKWFATVADRMDESLLVLQDMFKMHPLDVTYLNADPVATRRGDEDVSWDPESFEKAMERTESWHNVDHTLYQTARGALDEHLARIFPTSEVREEAVAKLRELSGRLNTFCAERTAKNLPSSLVQEWCAYFRMDDEGWRTMYFNLKEIKQDEFYAPRKASGVKVGWRSGKESDKTTERMKRRAAIMRRRARGLPEGRKRKARGTPSNVKWSREYRPEMTGKGRGMHTSATGESGH